MEFKFDTKPTYTVITPETNTLDANLTEKLAGQIALCITNGANNFIIDMQFCAITDNKSFDSLAELHEDCYMNERSFVLTGLQQPVMQQLVENELADMLNIAPTMQEAVDIVSMDILERDLLNEE